MARRETRWTVWPGFTHQRSAVRYRPRPPVFRQVNAISWANRVRQANPRCVKCLVLLSNIRAPSPLDESEVPFRRRIHYGRTNRPMLSTRIESGRPALADAHVRHRPSPRRRARSAKASSAAMTSSERQTRLRGPELVSTMMPAFDKGSRCRRACFDSIPNSSLSSAVLTTGRRSRRSAICHTAESLRAVILSFHPPRTACKSLTS